MKIEKFDPYNEPYTADDYDYDFGGHIFVLARYKKGWNNIQRSFEDDEFVPCMINGNPSSKWGKRNIVIIGNNQSYDTNDFEILKGSDKSLQELIEMYASTKKFNI